MRFTIILFSTILIALNPVIAYSVSAWSGSVCSGIEVGSIEDDSNPDGLSDPESTPTALCLLFEAALPDNCDVYLCADANCDDQGVTVAGPRDAADKVQNQDFQGMQVGCQDDD